MNKMKKLTGEEILKLVENSGLSISEFAHEGVNDFNFFNNYSENLRVHIEKTKSLSYTDRKKYEQFVLEGESIYNLKKKEFEEAGSPKIIGEVEEVEQYGGEDQGSTWYSVKHFVDHDVYIRTDGYYQSYSGTDFYNGYGKVVTPQKKTITVFE